VCLSRSLMCNGRRDEGLPSAVGGIFNVGSSAGMARTQVKPDGGRFPRLVPETTTARLFGSSCHQQAGVAGSILPSAKRLR
jgi:hypothetical protein